LTSAQEKTFKASTTWSLEVDVFDAFDAFDGSDAPLQCAIASDPSRGYSLRKRCRLRGEQFRSDMLLPCSTI